MKTLTLFFGLAIFSTAQGAILEKSIVERNRPKEVKKKKFLFIVLEKETETKIRQITLGTRSLNKIDSKRRPYFHSLIKLAANEWMRYAAVDFKILSEDSHQKADFEVNFIAPVIERTSRLGRSSHGSVNFEEKVINLNLPSDGSRGSHFQVTLHELGHVLGFKHEHQHPDRMFSFNFDLLMKNCGLGSSDVCRRSIDYNNMQTFYGNKYILKDYDQLSIMHYGVQPPVIMEDIVIHESRTLSLGDKLAAADAYPGRRPLEEIIQGHRSEEKVVSTGRIGKCQIEEESDRFYGYRYSNGSMSYFLEETFENAAVNALLDPKCQ